MSLNILLDKGPRQCRWWRWWRWICYAFQEKYIRWKIFRYDIEISLCK